MIADAKEMDSAHPAPEKGAPRKKGLLIVKLLIAAAAVAGLMVAGKYMIGPMIAALEWVENLGTAGQVLYVLLYIVCTVLFVPGTIITFGAGAMYGGVVGTILVSIGSTIGAAICFLIARYLMRSKVERWVAGSPKFAAIDRAVGEQGTKIVFLLRLSPLFPFNLLNYALGLTRAKFKGYLLASWIGMMPGTAMFVFIGAALGDLSRVVGASQSEQIVVIATEDGKDGAPRAYLRSDQTAAALKSGAAPDKPAVKEFRRGDAAVYAPDKKVADAYFSSLKAIEIKKQPERVEKFTTAHADGRLWIFKGDAPAPAGASSAARQRGIGSSDRGESRDKSPAVATPPLPASYALKTDAGANGESIAARDFETLDAYLAAKGGSGRFYFTLGGLLATVLVSLYVTAIARKALREAAGDLEQSKPDG